MVPRVTCVSCAFGNRGPFLGKVNPSWEGGGLAGILVGFPGRGFPGRSASWEGPGTFLGREPSWEGGVPRMASFLGKGTPFLGREPSWEALYLLRKGAFLGRLSFPDW